MYGDIGLTKAKLLQQGLVPLFIALIFAGYVYFQMRFGINVPFWDDWQLLDKIRLIATSQTGWWMLAASKHNEHLIGAAFLIQSLELLVTGFDYKTLLATGALLQGISFLVFACSLWQWIPERRRHLWLVVSCLIWFSIAQSKNLLWPFQTAWFMVSLTLGFTLLALQKAVETKKEYTRGGAFYLWFTVALLSAFFASFTSSQGMIVWAAGVVYLAGQCSFKIDQIRQNRIIQGWVSISIIAGVLIAFVWWNLGGTTPEGSQAFSISTLIYIFVGTHGDFWGNLGAYALLLLGIIMLAFVGLALLQVFFSKQRNDYALPVSLMAFGLGFVLLMAFGRDRFGSGPAADSHYTAYLVMTYFGVLSILMRNDSTVPSVFVLVPWRYIYSGLILLATFSSSYDAVLQGMQWRAEQGIAVSALLHYHEEPDFVLQRLLFGDAAMVRRNAEFLEANKFGPFGDPEAVPASVRSYSAMPKSMQQLLANHPAQQDAITRAWQVYQVGSDLRNAFNPISDRFTQDYLAWCASTSQTANAHYLGEYLAPYASDYAALQKTF